MNSNVWDYFDLKMCLTLDDRRPSGKPSRWPQFQNECKRVQLNNVCKFQALPAIGPHQSFTLSQKTILQAFLKTDCKRLLAFEDDCYFKDLTPLRDALYEIKLHKINWDVLYLGGNVRGDIVRVTRSLRRVSNVWTTHAIAYTRFAAEVILSNYPNENETMYDTYLGSVLPALKAHIVYPMVAFQRPDRSDIWGQDVNYDNIFKESEKKLQ